MSCKIDEIRSFEVLTNQPGLHKGKHYSGFEFGGDNYCLGWVVLSENGMKELNTKFRLAKIVDCWVNESGSLVYEFLRHHYIDTYHSRWETTSRYDIDLEQIIGDINGIDYKTITKDEILMLPKDEMFDHIKMKNMVDGTYQEPPKKMKPLFKDWQIPELVVGWIVFFIFSLVLLFLTIGFSKRF